MSTIQYTKSIIEAEQQRFITKVYGWMSGALAVTAFVAFYVSASPALINFFVGNSLIFFMLILAELILVATLAARTMKMSLRSAKLVFFFYAVLNGLTFSVIFLVYTASSIASTFFITAMTFGLMSIWGFITQKNLTSMGSFLFMALIGLILATVINWFLLSDLLYWITTYAGILIFVGLTAYDTQKIKKMNIIGNEGTDEDTKEAIVGALILYLDFINLFLYLLRLFGRRRN